MILECVKCGSIKHVVKSIVDRPTDKRAMYTCPDCKRLEKVEELLEKILDAVGKGGF